MPLQAHTSAIGSGGGVRVGIQRRRATAPSPPDPGKEKGLLVGAREPAPHHSTLGRVPVGLGEGCRRHDVAMLAVEPVSPQVVLQAPEVGPVTSALPKMAESPKACLGALCAGHRSPQRPVPAGWEDLQGIVARAHDVFPFPPDQLVVLHQITDFPGRELERVEIAHGGEPNMAAVITG